MQSTGTPSGVKWFYVIHRRGKARYEKVVPAGLAIQKLVEQPDGSTDLVRVGTAGVIEIRGYRTQWVAEVKKRIGRSLFTYHVTQPYTDKAACERAAQSSIRAGQHFEEVVWPAADEETRLRWLRAATGAK